MGIRPLHDRVLVEPLNAANTFNAFSNAARVNISRAVRPSTASATACRPVATPILKRAPVTAAGEAAPGNIMPNTSAKQAIVEAVPITIQVPDVGHRLCRTPTMACSSRSPARCCAQ